MEEKIENMDFENAMKKLEEINDRLEKNKVPLEEAVCLYEQGMKLVEYCGKKLDEAEGDIKKIIIDGDSESIEDL